MAYCYLCDREIDEKAVGDGEPVKDYFKPNQEGAFAWAHRWCQGAKGQLPVPMVRAYIKAWIEDEKAPAAILEQEKLF